MAYTPKEVTLRQNNGGCDMGVGAVVDFIDTFLLLNHEPGKVEKIDLSEVPDETAVEVAREYRKAGWDVDFDRGGLLVIRR